MLVSGLQQQPRRYELNSFDTATTTPVQPVATYLAESGEDPRLAISADGRWGLAAHRNVLDVFDLSQQPPTSVRLSSTLDPDELQSGCSTHADADFAPQGSHVVYGAGLRAGGGRCASDLRLRAVRRGANAQILAQAELIQPVMVYPL